MSTPKPDPAMGFPTWPPPMVCPECAAAENPLPGLDPNRQQVYCPHERVLVVWESREGRWFVRQDVDERSYRALLDEVATDAAILGDAGLHFSLEHGVHVPGDRLPRLPDNPEEKRHEN